ncbi:MAG: HAD family hydrolase [Bacteroidales bacterium]|nr:HAD family hydrolase [Bacteroidales bacterium]
MNKTDKKDKTVIFDYGATLDTNGVHWYHIFAGEHLKFNSYLTDEQMREAYVYGERQIAATRTVESMHNFLDTLLIKVDFQFDWLENNGIIKKECRHTEEISRNCYHLAKENTKKVRPMLEKLAESYNVGLVSNFYGNLDEVLKDFSLRDCFDDVVESAVVGISKPDKRLWQYALERLLTNAQDATVVGDSYKKDIMPTKQLGCSTIWLKGKGWKDIPQNTPFADAIITDIMQVENILG